MVSGNIDTSNQESDIMVELELNVNFPDASIDGHVSPEMRQLNEAAPIAAGHSLKYGQPGGDALSDFVTFVCDQQT